MGNARANRTCIIVVSVVQIWMANAGVAWPQTAANEPDASLTAPVALEDIPRYEPKLTLAAENSEVRTAIESSSLLFGLRAEELNSIGPLFERARHDLERIRRALNALGYFSARVEITIDGSAPGDAAAQDRLAANPPSRPLNVDISVAHGPMFKIGKVTFESAPASAANPLSILSTKLIGLEADMPARSSTVVTADARIVAALREAGYPLAAVSTRNAVADHATATLDIAYRIDAGAKAFMGDVAIKGNDRVKAPFIAGLAPFAAGDPFRSSALSEYRDELDRLRVFDSVAIEEAKTLDEQGLLPLTVSVNERPRRIVGVSASWSTFEGAALGAYWGHRNLFGEAEILRIEAEASRLFSNGTDDYEYALSSTLTLPAFPTRRDDVTLKLAAERDRLDAYSRDAIGFQGRLRRRFDKYLSAETGLDFTQAREIDTLGTRDRATVTLPIILTYDTRSNLLDPANGLRASGELTPLVGVSDGGGFAARFLGSISAYYALDENAQTVLAGRLAVGATSASAIADLPAEMRFFAGGSESVRGYPYQHLSPRNAADEIIGGRSLIEGSIELRRWVWEDIGFAAFGDAGGAYTSNYPDFDDTGAGVGLGVRYHTPVGPIRFDLAIPLDPRGSDASFAVYVALGQAF